MILEENYKHVFFSPSTQTEPLIIVFSRALFAQLGILVCWGNSLKIFLVMSGKVTELFITKSFLPLLSSSQEVQSLKNSALWIWNLLNNNKEKVSKQTKAGALSQWSCLGRPLQQLSLGNRKYLFLPFCRRYEFIIWHIRWSVLPSPWNKCSFSLKNMAKMVHSHPHAKLSITDCLFFSCCGNWRGN